MRVLVSVVACVLGGVAGLVGCGDDGAGTGASGGSGGGGTVAPTQIETTLGPVEGFASGETRVFLGIPFAAPPIGGARWTPPQPHSGWTEPLRAIARGPACPQLNPLNGEYAGGGDEDCLTVNVWSPLHPTAEKLPVLVWIHGGGYVLGSGGEAAYDGQVLSETTGHVVVTMNYRLGPLGFLALPELDDEDPAHPSSGNYGLEDQRAALAWVQANAAAFGGDPEAVTIFGESAGGASVCQQIVSPDSVGLFAAGVMQSGPCDLVVDRAAANGQGAELLAALGCDGPDPLACARDKTPEELLTALPAPSFGVGNQGTRWYPVIDGDFLPDRPTALLEAGDFANVPVIVGSNADEATLFFELGNLTVDDEAELEALAEQAAPGHGAEIVAMYPPEEYGSPQAAAVAAFSDAGFICPARRAARAFSANGAPTFLYHFTYGPPSLFGELGAFHSAEIKFVFGTPGQLLPNPLTDDELLLSRRMMGYWSTLHRRKPQSDEAPPWPAYDAASDTALVLDLAVTTQSGVRAESCDFWDGVALP